MQFSLKTILLVLIPTITLLLGGGCGGKNTILVTGFWPPTNEMLQDYSNNPKLNPAGWKGQNFADSGYDVYAYFPVFPEGTEIDPVGKGDFIIDYDQALRDFRRVTRKLRPAAIICYGQGAGPWEIEMNFPLHETWYPDYREPTLPYCLCYFGNRHEYGDVLHSTLPVAAIGAEVNAAVPELDIVVDDSGDAGKFVCNYMGFAAADYQETHDFCKAAGFIHVNANVPLETAKKAHEATLKAVVDFVCEDKEPLQSIFDVIFLENDK